jgi:hypothetical protein
MELKQALAELRSLLKRGLRRGDAVGYLARKVRQIFADPARAFRIATTESSRAMHGGALHAAKENPLVKKKEWLASSDACFGAGTLVWSLRGGIVQQVAIDTVDVGDLVVGGSGCLRRVIAVSNKIYNGLMVEGPDFSATESHKFLSEVGWKSIGEYAPKTNVGSFLYRIIRKSKDIPSTFFKVIGLSSILPSDVRFTVPILAVAEDDQIPLLNDKVNDPSVVHGNLLSKPDFTSSKEFIHEHLDVCSLCASFESIDPGTYSRAEDLGDSTGIGFERLLAITTSNINLWLFVVSVLFHPDAMEFVGAVSGAESSSGPFDIIPLGHKLPSTYFTSVNSKSGDVRVSEHSLVCTDSATELGPSFKRPGEYLKGFATRFARKLRSLLYAQDHKTFYGTAICFLFRIFPVLLAAYSAINKFFSYLRIPVASERAKLLTRFYSLNAHTTSPGHCGSLALRSKKAKVRVFDLSVEADHSFILSCGLVAHNCDICLELNGKQVEVDKPFLIDKAANPSYATIMHPPRHPH